MFEFWDDPRRPCCGICGGLILIDPRATEFYAKLENSTQGELFIRVSINEFREKLIQEPFLWQAGYRAVVKSGKQAPFLSGAGYRCNENDIDQAGTFPVPRNLETALLPRVQIWPEDEFIRIQKPVYPTRKVNSAWLFHEMCWVMLERIDDDNHIMNSGLDLFMVAVHDDMIQRRIEHASLINRTARNMSWTRRGFYEATFNPLNIPILMDIIQAALQPQIRGSEPFMPDTRSEAGFRISQGAFSKLHLETQQMIANNIEREIDLRSLLLATRWKFPSAYWKQRIPESLYEIHKGINDEQTDWQRLGLDVRRIMENKHKHAALYNRVRIHEHIKRLFGYLAKGLIGGGE